MWNYDKLFAKGNILGIKSSITGKIYNHVVEKFQHWTVYMNDSLSYKGTVSEKEDMEEYEDIFEIQYIVTLDENGNTNNVIFNRETDIMETITNEEIWEMLEPKMKKNNIEPACEIYTFNKETTTFPQKRKGYYSDDLKKAVAIAYKSGYIRSKKKKSFMITSKIKGD